MKIVTNLADAILKIEQNPEFQAALKRVKQEREKSPARHERKYNVDLMRLSHEINAHSLNIAIVTQQLRQHGQDFSKEDLDLAWNSRKEEVFAAATAYKKYDALVAKLDQAIIDEDNLTINP